VWLGDKKGLGILSIRGKNIIAPSTSGTGKTQEREREISLGRETWGSQQTCRRGSEGASGSGVGDKATSTGGNEEENQYSKKTTT